MSVIVYCLKNRKIYFRENKKHVCMHRKTMSENLRSNTTKSDKALQNLKNWAFNFYSFKKINRKEENISIEILKKILLTKVNNPGL